MSKSRTTANLGPVSMPWGWHSTCGRSRICRNDDRQITLTISGEGEGNSDRCQQPDRGGCPAIYELARNLATASAFTASTACAQLRSGLQFHRHVDRLLGANALLGNPFNDEEILKLAIENEGHPITLRRHAGRPGGSIVYEGRSFRSNCPPRNAPDARHIVCRFRLPTRRRAPSCQAG